MKKIDFLKLFVILFLFLLCFNSSLKAQNLSEIQQLINFQRIKQKESYSQFNQGQNFYQSGKIKLNKTFKPANISPKTSETQAIPYETFKQTISYQEKPSSIEKSFWERLKDYNIKLKQFGYDFFQNEIPIPPSVCVDSSYILGPGDQLFIYIIGQIPGVDMSQFPQTLVVDREGKIYIPGLGVFYVWGKTLGEVEKEISNALKINIKLTVGKLRTFPVYVTGEVNTPGAIAVTALHTVLDALIMAGGVKKTGSLRNIILTRKINGKTKKIKIDLYDLFLKGNPVDIRLRDGDVIFVPSIKNVAGIAGAVQRPAIYEFKPGDTIKTLLNMAGGILPSSYGYKIVLQRYKAHKELEVFEGSLNDTSFLSQKLKPGDLVFIKRISPFIENSIEVKGYVKYPGIYEYKKGLKLSDILTKDMLLPDTDLNYAEIDRRDLNTLKIKKIIRFSPLEVLEHKKDIALQPLDVIKFFPKYVYPPIKVSGCIENPKYIPYHPGITLKDALADVRFCRDVKNLKAVILPSKNATFYLIHNATFLNATNNPPFGSPSLSSNASLNSTSNSTFLQTSHYFYLLTQPVTIYLYNLLVENNLKDNIPLLPGTQILIKPTSPQEVIEKVTIAGYVKKPGIYPLKDGMTLYDLLKEAGGFRKEAYPQGIVILRNSIAKMQKQMLSKAIIKMQKQLEKEESGILQADLTKGELQARQAAIEAKRKLLELMQKTEVTGRITGLQIPKNIELLKNSPYNILLEDGDKIFVPKKPEEVLIFGEVNNPSALVYQPGLTVEDYIKEAGGFTKYADIENIFIIKPNGSAISFSNSKGFIYWDKNKKRFVLWGGCLGYIPQPGDAIIVPTKIKVPIMWRPLIKDVIQIIYQSALTVYTISHL